MARRLPVYFLLDVSESMAGAELKSLEGALKSITEALRKNPYALETVWTSVISFAGRAKTLVPLTELVAFISPELSIGGGTALGNALEHLMTQLDKDVRKGSAEQKGDWKPVVFLITDGSPTDDPSRAVDRWNREFRSRASLVAVSIGGHADQSIMGKLTEDVIIFNDQAPDAFTKFAQWISASVTTQSQNVQSGAGEKVSLAKPDGEVVSEAGPGPGGHSDERYVVVVGKCSKKKLPYLFKYARTGNGDRYRFADGVKLDAHYGELTGEGGAAPTVSTNRLDGADCCPQCGNDSGFCVCSCGQIMCSASDNQPVTCPTCGLSGIMEVSEEAMTVSRGKG